MVLDVQWNIMDQRRPVDWRAQGNLTNPELCETKWNKRRKHAASQHSDPLRSSSPASSKKPDHRVKVVQKVGSQRHS